MHDQRKKVWVDRFQTKLMWRLGVYLAVYLFCWTSMLFTWRLLHEGAGQPIRQYLSALADSAPALICLVCLLPVLIYDAVRFTHRLVGPLVRFRHTMQAIARGETVRPIKLRAGDYLDELRDDFNAMLDSLQRQGVPVLRPLDVDLPQQERKGA